MTTVMTTATISAAQPTCSLAAIPSPGSAVTMMACPAGLGQFTISGSFLDAQNQPCLTPPQQVTADLVGDSLHAWSSTLFYDPQASAFQIRLGFQPPWEGMFNAEVDVVADGQRIATYYALGDAANTACDGAESDESTLVMNHDNPGAYLSVNGLAKAISRCAGNGQATVTFTVAAMDSCGGALTPVCTPPSGSSFVLGTTPVICGVMDGAGNPASCTFNVIVQDTQAPVFGPLPDVPAATATSTAGATVTFTCPEATDACDGPIAGTCSPVSGSTFAPGTTPVSVSATDSHSNTGHGSFDVTVTYAWSDFLSPFLKAVYKSGSTIPIKFMLTGASAGIENLAAKGYWAPVTGGVPGPDTLIGQFKYDPLSGNYVLNWSTKPSVSGTYRFKADFGDGVLRAVDVDLK